MGRRLPKTLEAFDIKLLVNLATYGPRNLTKIARKMNTSTEMIRLRIKRMSSLFYLRLITNVYHTNLGLKKAVVFAPATPGYEDLLYECMKVNNFYQYLSRCYGMFEGCLCVYTIPKGHDTELKQFIWEIEKLGIAKNTRIFWSTCFHTVQPTGKWFDFKSETWIFPWDKWIEEVRTQGTELPYTLVDPEDFPMKFNDEIDLFILQELEKDATVTFTAIGKKLGVSKPTVKYHFQKHIIEQGIIEHFRVFFAPYNGGMPDLFYFILEFDNKENMAKLALSLLDKPFVYIIGKILGENALIAQICLPRPEFRRFVESLSKLVRSSFLQNYSYLIQDIRWKPKKTWSRMEIPYKYFKDESWIYDHKKYMKGLRDLVKAKKS